MGVPESSVHPVAQPNAYCDEITLAGGASFRTVRLLPVCARGRIGVVRMITESELAQ